MAHEKETTAAATPRAKGGMMNWVLTGVVGVVSAGAGFAVPQVLRGGAAGPADETEHGNQSSAKEVHKLESAVVPFGDVVANLDDNRMTRYLRVKFALSVAKKDAESVQHVVEERKTNLKNWLIGYLQSKQVEDVRGTAGFNQIRREIHDQFNQMLFPSGDEKIQDILFDEFNVQ